MIFSNLFDLTKRIYNASFSTYNHCMLLMTYFLYYEFLLFICSTYPKYSVYFTFILHFTLTHLIWDQPHFNGSVGPCGWWLTYWTVWATEKNLWSWSLAVQSPCPVTVVKLFKLSKNLVSSIIMFKKNSMR